MPFVGYRKAASGFHSHHAADELHLQHGHSDSAFLWDKVG